VMYVDNDPLVFSRASPLTAADGVSVVQADLRDVDGVLSRGGDLVDLSQPAGMLFVGCLHHIVDADDPAGLVARYLAALHRVATWSSRMSPATVRPRRCGRTRRWPRAAAPPHPARPGRGPADVQRAQAGRTRACPGLLLAA
jgi:hypothetical protein